jgi:hypothetical protein
MKLKKNIYKTNTDFLQKFENCSPSKIKRGDYIQLYYLAYNQKRRGGDSYRINQQTVILQKKKRRKNTLSMLVTSLYKQEKVKWRYLISSPLMVKVVFLKKQN